MSKKNYKYNLCHWVPFNVNFPELSFLKQNWVTTYNQLEAFKGPWIWATVSCAIKGPVKEGSSYGGTSASSTWLGNGGSSTSYSSYPYSPFFSQSRYPTYTYMYTHIYLLGFLFYQVALLFILFLTCFMIFSSGVFLFVVFKKPFCFHLLRTIVCVSIFEIWKRLKLYSVLMNCCLSY